MEKLTIDKKDRVALEANMQGIENAVLAAGDGEINGQNILYHIERVREIQDKVFGNIIDDKDETEENEGDVLARNTERPTVQPSIH